MGYEPHPGAPLPDGRAVIPVALFLAVTLALCVALGIVVYQRNKARGDW